MEAAGRGGEARVGERDALRGNSAIIRAIGRYRVSRLLGEGTMGRVYLAADPELGREVAIKVLRLDAAGGARDAYIARFRNEARAAARFNHPNVVSVYDAGVDPELGPYLVYEYVPGRTLRKRIEEARLDPDELMPIAKGVAAALDALHAAGIIHRDIKPDNILLAPTGAVKLTDFGIARVPDAALTRDGQFLGTPAYASPEAITRGEYSVAGDVFSLAAVLFEAMCGIRPFPGEDAVAVSYAVANETAPPPSKFRPDVPAAVDPVFARAMARRKHERFETAGEFARALGQAFRPGATASATGLLTSQAGGASANATQRRPQIPQSTVDAAKPKSAVPVVLVAVILTALALMIVRRYTGGDAGDGSESTPTHGAANHGSGTHTGAASTPGTNGTSGNTGRTVPGTPRNRTAPRPR